MTVLPRWVNTIQAAPQSDSWVIISGLWSREAWVSAAFHHGGETLGFVPAIRLHCAQPWLFFLGVLNVKCLCSAEVLEELTGQSMLRWRWCSIIYQDILVLYQSANWIEIISQAGEPSLPTFQSELSIKSFSSCWFSKCDVYKVWFAGK